MTFTHRIMVSAAVFFWGSSFVITKLGVATIPPFMFATLRGLCVIPLVFFLPRPQESFGTIMGLGALWGFFQVGMGSLAFTMGVDSGIAALIVQLGIFWSAILGWKLLGEDLSSHMIIGLLVGLLGVAVALSPTIHLSWQNGTPLIFVAAASWGLGKVLLKKVKSPEPLALSAWVSVLGIVPLMITSLIFESATWADTFSHMTVSNLALIIYSGAFISVGAPYLWMKVLKHYPASLVTPYCFLEPVIAIGLAALLAHESPNVPLLIGLMLVILSLMIGEGYLNRFFKASPQEQ